MARSPHSARFSAGPPGKTRSMSRGCFSSWSSSWKRRSRGVRQSNRTKETQGEAPPVSQKRLHLRRAISRILSPELSFRLTIISLTRPGFPRSPDVRPVQAADATNTRKLSRDRERPRNRTGGPASCYVLHHMGFFVPRPLRAGRWALTPPFHPYPISRETGRFNFL